MFSDFTEKSAQTVQDIDISKKNILINGDVQSGKTTIIIELALRIFNENKNVFIFVNNFNMDLLQIKNRFENYFSENKLKNCVKLIDKKIKKKDIENKAIYIALCNASKINDINNNFVENNKQDYCCIIDESDLFNQDADKNDKDTLNKVSKELNFFLSKANPIVRVTATSFSHMYVNEIYPLKGHDVYFMNKKDSYISFGHDNFKVIPIKNENGYEESESGNESDEIIDDTEEQKLIEEFQEEESSEIENSEEFVKEADLYLNTQTYEWTDKQKNIFYSIVESDREYFTSKNILPIMIVNVSTLVKNHNYIKSIINQKYDDITVIMINESNVLIEYTKKNEKNEKKEIQNNFNTVQEGLTYIKSNIDVNKIVTRYSFLQNKTDKNEDENKEFKKLEKKMDIYSLVDHHDHKMVIIITCLQMGRGISPRSEVMNFTDIKSIIYANSMIYCCSSSQSIDKIIQGSMRIGGQFPGYKNIDGFELRLHTTNSIAKAIKDQFEWFSCIKENIKLNPELKLTELITPLKEKPLRKPMSSSRGKFKCKKINGLYECTEDRIKLAKENKEISEITNNSIRHHIIQILKNNVNKKLTAKEIKDQGILSKLWNIDNNQLYRNITSVLSKQEDNVKREKNSEGIYVYWI